MRGVSSMVGTAHIRLSLVEMQCQAPLPTLPRLALSAPRPAPAARTSIKLGLLLVVERGMKGFKGRHNDVHRLLQCREPLLQERNPLVRAARNLRRAHAGARIRRL